MRGLLVTVEGPGVFDKIRVLSVDEADWVGWKWGFGYEVFLLWGEIGKGIVLSDVWIIPRTRI